MGIVDGDGTQGGPLKIGVRHAINLLIKSPRSSIGELKEAGPGLSRLNQLELAWLLDLIQLRVAIPARRRVSTMDAVQKSGMPAGTQLVEVSLKRNTAEAHQEFQSKIQDISGVIEWDKISGIIDYLVRIATPIDLDGQAIKDKIQGIDCVRDVKGSTYTVTRSGIVDNVTADMFLSFQVESS